MKAKLPPIMKRISWALVLGFALSWIIAWSLSLLPRITLPGFFLRAERDANPYAGIGDIAYFGEGTPPPYVPEEVVVITTLRWIGVQETQLYNDSHVSLNSRLQSYVYLEYPWWTLSTGLPNIENPRFREVLKAEFPNSDPQVGSVDHAVLRYGFPFISHEAHAAYFHHAVSAQQMKVHGAFAQPLPPFTSPVWSRRDQQVPFAELVYLPYSPIWIGLLLNTLFYSVVVFAFSSIKRAFRHARRMQRGKCPICAYNLLYDNTTGCPECGWHKTKTG